MNPIERALGILLLLTGGKLVTATTLSERFNVSLRTIYRDIDRLISLGVPVDAERGAEGGYRLSQDYLQAPVALTRNETAALLTALALVRGIRTIPLATDLDSAQKKLVATLPKAVHALLGEAERIIGIEPVPADIFHSNTRAEPTPLWQQAIDGFMQGLLESRRVRFLHNNPARGEPRPHDVEPRGILYDRDLWYMAGFCVDTRQVKVYRADRVREMEVSGFRFRQDKTFAIESLLGGAWLKQAMRRWETESPIARIRITAEQAAKLSSDWYYRHAVLTAEESGSLIIAIPDTASSRILPLVRWLGPGAELLEPEHMRQELAEELKSLAQTHGGLPQAS
ncbi:helix-turn-helix transcriptional regulator [Roseibium litorale]|uniref:WYL domain-containing protein n=1 Tax=Roseibium litorale TaxID=2803841 RepID=A0ABR9CNI6_9HYPH|nr:WYL domain-containing protein [Roseibium litorale]MBD8892444.1 WYL domain-containing protein [Roseibium litorale]